jgi:hypothetical protein
VKLWPKLFALAVALPVLASAADPEMMNLVMPDAKGVMEINIARIAASPIGSALGDAVHQGVTTQLKSELGKAKPQFQEQIAALGNIDWLRDVRDVVIAGGPGKQPAVLVIVRTSLDAAKIAALQAFSGNAATYEGVPLLASSKPGGGTIAFLENSIVVIGQADDVKAAISRRHQHTALPEALAAQVAKYSRYDLWFASTEFPTESLDGGKTKSQAGAQAAQFIQKVAGFNGGLRVSPDLDISADLEARTEKAAAEMGEGLHMITSMVQAQAKSGGKGSGLEGLKYRVNGKHILLSLHVPEAQLLAGLQQMRTAQTMKTAAAAKQAPVVSAMREVPAAAPSTGVPPPPAGTIRVQSSEMGTVIIPVGKQ